MNAHSLLAHLFHPGSNEAQAALLEAEQLIRLPPTLTADELPPEFAEILEVQVLGTVNASSRFTAAADGACSIRFGRWFPRTDSEAYNSPTRSISSGRLFLTLPTSAPTSHASIAPT
jgi:hypothetical protein